LERTIESVLSQRRDLFEFIVVDGGSSDDTLSIVEKYSRELNVSSEHDRGIYDAFNKGVGKASGRYLYFLGAGDRLRAGVLEEVDRLVPIDDRTFLYGSALLVRQGVVLTGCEIDQKHIKHWNICHQAIFYGREIFETVGSYSLDYEVYGDWEMNLKCFGERRIPKKFMPLVVADFEGGGASDMKIDSRFEKDLPRLVMKHLGVLEYVTLWTDPLRSRLSTQRQKMQARAKSLLISIRTARP
jgi:glycosyltransferase involved in cell wall biosynthesis